MSVGTDLITAQTYCDHGHEEAGDRVALNYENRFLRRKVLTTEGGARLLVNLAQTTSLNHQGRLLTTDGQEIEVIAAPEALLEVTGPDIARLAWHIGNRHTPCQIARDRLLIQRDPVIRHMLEQLGAAVIEITAPFTPEGGAYGHGRTHSHEHGHSTHAH
ncbi:MAG: urease accessory protein UreE [Pseudomonadota bacterium]